MPRRHRSDSGFALLIVYLMAAIIAISLYIQLPRVAFQSQRQKEQMLLERGEQYKLAVRRFMQVNNRLPASLDELEKLNNRHFLRRKYKDPMTGKDEWRILHMAGGVLTDSKNGKQTGPKTQANPNNFVAEMPGLGSIPTSGQSNAVTRRRPSDGGGADFSQLSSTIAAGTGQAGSTPPPSPGNIPGVPGAPVNSQTGGVSPTPSTGGSFVGSGGSFVGGGSNLGSQPNNPTGAPGSPTYAGQNPGYPTAAGSNGTTPGFPNPGGATGQSSQAVNMINSILTSPRPGGLAGIQGQGGVMGTGIAGVASTVDEDSLMVYTDYTNYSHWEFVYDGKYTAPPDPRSGNGGTPASQLGNLAGSSPPGTPIGGNSPSNGAPGLASSPAGTSVAGIFTTPSQGTQGTATVQMGQGGQPGQSIGIGGAANTQTTNLNLRPGRR